MTAEGPEQRERQPVLGVVLDLDFRILDVDQMLLAARGPVLVAGIAPPLPIFGQPVARTGAVALDPSAASAMGSVRTAAPPPAAVRTYFSACSASYSAWLQPPLPSLCSGRAAARKAARSTSTTFLPSFLNSSASFCSEARMASVALAAACDQHLVEDLLLVVVSLPTRACRRWSAATP